MREAANDNGKSSNELKVAHGKHSLAWSAMQGGVDWGTYIGECGPDAKGSFAPSRCASCLFILFAKPPVEYVLVDWVDGFKMIMGDALRFLVGIYFRMVDKDIICNDQNQSNRCRTRESYCDLQTCKPTSQGSSRRDLIVLHR